MINNQEETKNRMVYFVSDHHFGHKPFTIYQYVGMTLMFAGIVLFKKS